MTSRATYESETPDPMTRSAVHLNMWPNAVACHRPGLISKDYPWLSGVLNGRVAVSVGSTGAEIYWKMPDRQISSYLR
jgi:hypothetical protein